MIEISNEDLTLAEKILLTLKELSKTSELNLVRPVEIANRMKYDLNTVNKYLYMLKKQKLVNNPVYAHWTLTEKGLKAIEKICQIDEKE
ncbi:MAG: hypothetical protein ACFFG0_56565 [Candidatus Thorarchaeota archaeon]